LSRNIAIITLGALGVITSWALFVPSAIDRGFIASWVAAFTADPFGLGLHLDLVFSAALMVTIAALDRDRLGPRYAIGTVVMACVFGVCAAIAVYWIGLRRGRGASD